MSVPAAGFAMLLASLIVAVPSLAGPAESRERESRRSSEPVRLDREVRRDWRRAIANDDARSLSVLLERHPEGALPGSRAPGGKSALMVACKSGDLDLAKRLVDAGDDPRATTATGGTPFMFAVLGNRLEVARWLHGLGAETEARGSNGWSAATIAAAKGFDAMLAWLLSIGVEADRADVYGFTPLMRAVDNAHAEAARRLLAAGADIDATDERGNAALHHAVGGGRAELVTLLLEHGANTALVNRGGLTPADLTGSSAPAPDGRPREPLPPALLARLRLPPPSAR